MNMDISDFVKNLIDKLKQRNEKEKKEISDYQIISKEVENFFIKDIDVYNILRLTSIDVRQVEHNIREGCNMVEAILIVFKDYIKNNLNQEEINSLETKVKKLFRLED
ncbi:MAG: hypothetical protein ACRCUM_03935 [Mycoplasmoidaceae bacterium]